MRPTSKFSLKRDLWILYKGDVEEAQRAYEFLVGDMESLPDTDPVELSALEKVKIQIKDIFTAYKENKDDIDSAIIGLRGMMQKSQPQGTSTAEKIIKGAVTLPPIPQINITPKVEE